MTEETFTVINTKASTQAQSLRTLAEPQRAKRKHKGEAAWMGRHAGVAGCGCLGGAVLPMALPSPQEASACHVSHSGNLLKAIKSNKR